MKRAFITGATGMDGSYMCDLLLFKGYKVYGMARRSSSPNLWRIRHLSGNKNFQLLPGDLLDMPCLQGLLKATQPHEVYHFAAQSHVSRSFTEPILTHQTNALGTLHMLEALRLVSKKSRLYIASSSEMLGNDSQDIEDFRPGSPYGVSKLDAHCMAKVYRDLHNLYIVRGLAFNHDGPRRGTEFFTQKVAQGVAAIKYGKMKKLRLGNLEPIRDMGYAPEYVDRMYQAMQGAEPNDPVFATGHGTSMREVAKIAFKRAQLDMKDHVVIDRGLKRPNEIYRLVGPKPLYKVKRNTQSVIKEMVDCALAQHYCASKEPRQSRASRA